MAEKKTNLNARSTAEGPSHILSIRPVNIVPFAIQMKRLQRKWLLHIWFEIHFRISWVLINVLPRPGFLPQQVSWDKGKATHAFLHSICNLQYWITNMQYSICIYNMQYAIFNVQYPTCNIQLAIFNMQPRLTCTQLISPYRIPDWRKICDQ